MIDTHAHLHMAEFEADRARILARAFALGVSGIVEVGIDADSWPAVLALASADGRVHAAIGIHPHAAGEAQLARLRELPRLAHRPEVVAVGETGMDAVRSRTSREDQQALLREQVGLARELELPLILHCREAFAEIFRILDDEGRGRVRGVFHCFSGGESEIREIAARGFLIGLGGRVTYEPQRWEHLLAAIPAEALVLETDAPYLRPAPDRRGRNEPGFVWETARAVAALLAMDVTDLEARVDRNAVRLFGPRLAGAGSPAGRASRDGES